MPKPKGWYSRQAVRERRERHLAALEAGRVNPGWFQAGHDPRRYQFTEDDCREGWDRAIASLVSRYGESHGMDRNAAAKFLCRMAGDRPQRRKEEDPFA